MPRGSGAVSRRAWAAAVFVVAVAGAVAWIARRPEAPVVAVAQDTTVLNRLGLTSAAYDLALTRVGARPWTVRPGDLDPAEIVRQADAVLLAGGGDVSPGRFGDPTAHAELVDPARDAFEEALIRHALAQGVPLLGICRGLQLLNVAMGGTLVDLRTKDPTRHATHGIGINSLSAHAVHLTPGTRLADALVVGERRVTSFHGQAVGVLAKGLRATAVAPDGVVEAAELADPDGPWIVAVQWHPEIESVADSGRLALFRELVRRARLRP